MEVLSSFKFRLGVHKCSRFATTIPDSKACLNSDWNDIRQPETAIRAPDYLTSHLTTSCSPQRAVIVRRGGEQQPSK